jgi:hypothetical protein
MPKKISNAADAASMGFGKSKTLKLDFNLLSEGDEAVVKLTGFRYMKGYCFAVLTTSTNHALEAFVGDKEECSMEVMMKRKGSSVTVRYDGTTVKNDNTYPRYSIIY